MSCPSCNHRLSLRECLPRFQRGPRECPECATSLYVNHIEIRQRTRGRLLVLMLFFFVIFGLLAALEMPDTPLVHIGAWAVFVLLIAAGFLWQARLLQRCRFLPAPDPSSQHRRRHMQLLALFALPIYLPHMLPEALNVPASISGLMSLIGVLGFVGYVIAESFIAQRRGYY